jgi:hypothetical protein
MCSQRRHAKLLPSGEIGETRLQLSLMLRFIQIAWKEGAFMARVMTVLDVIFGCHHWHLSRVFTIDRQTYRVCCDCGAKFNYSLDSMCMERSLQLLHTRHATA